MDLLKIATEWARAEVFSTRFFILFALLFLAASVGFWQLGKSEIARAYIIPTLVAGGLLLIIGVGLFFTNKARITQFEKAFYEDSSSFARTEMTRAEGTLREYQTVFKVIPCIIIVAALLILFVPTPIWRAAAISTIAMMIVILLIDGTAHGRMEVYHQQLQAIIEPEED